MIEKLVGSDVINQMRPPIKREGVVTILGNYRLLSQLGEEPELFSLSEHLVNMSERAKSQLA